MHTRIKKVEETHDGDADAHTNRNSLLALLIDLLGPEHQQYIHYSSMMMIWRSMIDARNRGCKPHTWTNSPRPAGPLRLCKRNFQTALISGNCQCRTTMACLSQSVIDNR